MSDKATVVNIEDAYRLIREVQDPFVRRLLDVSHARLLAKLKGPTGYELESNLDLRLITEWLTDLFSDKEYIIKLLGGQKTGHWEDEFE